MAAGEIRHRNIETNSIRMHIAEQGEGPLVVLCHGFPESWSSWRHQLPALAAAGFHAVAPDMRGYGQTGRPEAIDQYTLLHLVEATWWASSTRWAPNTRSSPDTIGGRRWPGTPPSYA